jgi:putative transcriptional regulator
MRAQPHKGRAPRSRKPTVGDELVRGLTGLRETLSSGGRVSERFTMRIVELDISPRQWSAADVRALRSRLQASQSVFARLIGVSVKTVQAWEQGGRPPLMACRLLECIRADIDPWLMTIRNAAITKKAG